jgi:hypothetical protein
MNEIMYEVDRQGISKTKNDDRILVLKPIEGGATNSSGMVDKRLFTGDNKLHIFQDPASLLWRARFEAGVVPPGLSQGFTSYIRAYEAVEKYYLKRNVKIVEVID